MRDEVVAPKMKRCKAYANDSAAANEDEELYKTEKSILRRLPADSGRSPSSSRSTGFFWRPSSCGTRPGSAESRSVRPDPYFVLPVVYAITAYLQVKLHDADQDPVQAKVMKISRSPSRSCSCSFPPVWCCTGWSNRCRSSAGYDRVIERERRRRGEAPLKRA